MLANLSFDLGVSQTGKAIGYRVLQLNGTTYAAFTTTNVIESTVTLGKYIVTASVTLPDAGCRIIVGTSGSDIDEYTVDPLPAVNLATDAINATSLASSAVTEINAGTLATLTSYDVATGTDVSLITASVVAQNPPSINAGQINMQRAVTYDGTLTGISIIPADWVYALFTVKRRVGDPDSAAVLQIKVTNGGDVGDGLKIVNGSSSVTASNASMAVNQGAGTVALHIEDNVLADIVTKSYYYDCKFYYGTSDSVATAPMRCVVAEVVTETV